MSFLPHEENSVAVIGNYLPRKCGIATFTTDLVKSLSAHNRNCRYDVIAINDRPEGYDYPDEVTFEIQQDRLKDYRTAAEYLNINRVDMVCLQHEFGIFGGKHGDYILTLLEDLKVPVVTTLHTVLVESSPQQKAVMERLIELSDSIIVMSQTAVHILTTLYDLPKEKITYIPHGIPDIPFVDPNYYKEKFDLPSGHLLLTFGLLSENKGIEYVIQGLPEVVKKFPNLTYIVLGATHPHVKEWEGEKYRTKLQQLVRKLELEDHVVFENHFVSYEELCEYLAATDIYITPYNNEDQITSGTLAYASGTGKAVISTPYWYAQEMLSEGRGRLVPFRDAAAISDSIIQLLDDDTKRHEMRKRAYDFNRSSTWPEVASQYFKLFHELKSDRVQGPRPVFTGNEGTFRNDQQLPPVKLNHLLALTDDTGIIQHATYTIPNRHHGYCTDDNARALIFALKAGRLSKITPADAAQLKTLSDRYLSFLLYAYDDKTGRFRNFMDYSRQWLNLVGSEDSHGRALWALGTTVSTSIQKPQIALASGLFASALQPVETFSSPRAIAFTLIGIDAYLKRFPGDSTVRRTGITLAEWLLNQFTVNGSEDWPWAEDILAYSNGKLPHALILAGQFLQREYMIGSGLRSLNWLLDIQIKDNHLSPIGNYGWYVRNGRKAAFDQQPLEAHSLLEACISAYQITGQEQWLQRARICFNWFLGENDLHLSLHDAQTTGCRDGLERDRINQNQGAESTLAWLLSLATMHRLSDEEALKSAGSKRSNSYSNNGRGER